MKKIFMSILASCMLYSYNSGIEIGGMGGSQSGIIKGSGILVKKSFKLEDFNRVKVDASINLIIKKASTSEYSIEADDNLISLISVKKRGRTLIISSKKSYQTNNDIKIVLYTKALNFLIANTSADIKLNGLNEEELLIKLDGAIDLIATSGNIGSLTVKTDGSYDVDLSSLKVKNAKVKMKGSGDVSIYVSKRLDATVSDNASLSYSGGATVVKKISGNGDIDKN